MTEFFELTFPVSGVTTNVFIPPLVAFFISFLTSMGGVSGAFLLLPFQMSILGYTSPSVSGTNHLFNVVAIPSGVWRYIKEKRMVWPLTWAVIIGTLPGVVAGAWIRLKYLPDPENFKIFAGFVLLYIGLKLFRDIYKTKNNSKSDNLSGQIKEFEISETQFSMKQSGFTFAGQKYTFSIRQVFLLCLIVGIIGGIYGIGGGAIIAPVFITFFHLPVYAVAGAALMGTFITSVLAVIIYQIMAVFYPNTNVAPDWYLGILFGLGGLCGMYLGARCQKYVPSKIIKIILCLCLLFIAFKYIVKI